MCGAVTPSALIVVGGHSRGVGKTLLVEQLLRGSAGANWIAVKISAHRHAPDGADVPLIEEARDATARTQTGRYLAAGASRAFLVRAPDRALVHAAAFIQSMRAAGAHVIVESNRLVRHVRPDLLLFVVDPRIADWKDSSDECVRSPAAVICRRTGARFESVTRVLTARPWFGTPGVRG
jgi:hypothetical protein